jgi:hypothetical protein
MDILYYEYGVCEVLMMSVDLVFTVKGGYQYWYQAPDQFGMT